MKAVAAITQMQTAMAADQIAAAREACNGSRSGRSGRCSRHPSGAKANTSCGGACRLATMPTMRRHSASGGRVMRVLPLQQER
jgi:hypothetical protein